MGILVLMLNRVVNKSFPAALINRARYIPFRSGCPFTSKFHYSALRKRKISITNTTEHTQTHTHAYMRLDIPIAQLLCGFQCRHGNKSHRWLCEEHFELRLDVIVARHRPLFASYMNLISPIGCVPSKSNIRDTMP